MNRYYNYEGIDLWQPERWGERSLPMNNLAQWLGELDPLVESEYTLPEGMNPELNHRVDGFLGYLPPEEIEYWDKRGYSITLRHIWVAKWIALVPKSAVRNSGNYIPTLLAMHQEHIRTDWAAKTLRACRSLADSAADEGMIIIITVTDGPDVTMQYANILMEAISLYPIDTGRISLDISAVYASGHKLSDLPGGLKTGFDGAVAPDPDALTEKLGSLRVIDISSVCKNKGSPNQGQFVGVDGRGGGNASYDPRRCIHTLAARRDIEPLMLEHSYLSDTDPGFLDYMQGMGLVYETHIYNHEKYVTLTPRAALERDGAKLPMMLIFQEVYRYNDHLPIQAISYWFEYCKIAAQSECMLLFYACEEYEHNKNMINVYRDALKKYPIDPTRVYVTGYSHNGATAARFAFDYPDVITALAGGAPGMLGPVSEAQQKEANARQAKIDMPCVQIVGLNEHTSPAPSPTFQNSGRMIAAKMNALEAGNCPLKTMEDFKEAFENGDKATRMVGVPNDRSEVLYLEGVEHYICDVKNNEGKWHLRFGAIENAPHNPFPTKLMLEWSFVRRFARDPVTHEIIELY